MTHSATMPAGQLVNEPKGATLARRRYQRGSVFLRGKNWVARWREDSIGVDSQVRRVRRSEVIGTLAEFPTKRLAARRMELILAHVNAPGYRPSRVCTVAEFSERWERDVLSQRKPSTRKAAMVHLGRHIKPALGQLRLDAITIEKQQQFVSALTGQLRRKTILNVAGTLSSMMNKAKEWGYAAEGVSLRKLAFPPRGVRAPARFFTADEARNVIAAAREPYGTLYALAALTGMRAGELCGLKVSDLDFARRMICVQRAAWQGKLQAPKSESSVRVLPMPEFLRLRLTRFLQTWRPNPDGLLFATRRGRPMNPTKVVQRNLHPLLELLGIRKAGLHAFRHTHSSLLIEQGTSPTVTGAQLGHSDPRITLAVYSHILGDAHREAVEKLSVVLDLDGPGEKHNRQHVN